MALNFLPLPTTVDAAIADGLSTMAQKQQFRISSLAKAAAPQLTYHAAHPVYNLGLDQILAQAPLESLTQGNWRVLVQNNGVPVAAAESQKAAGATSATILASVNEGPFVQGTVKALQSAGSASPFAGGQWDVRLVRVPALFAMVLWLHGSDGEGDFFRPIEPAPHALDVQRNYTWAELTAALHPAAQEKLKFDDQPKP